MGAAAGKAPGPGGEGTRDASRQERGWGWKTGSTEPPQVTSTSLLQPKSSSPTEGHSLEKQSQGEWGSGPAEGGRGAQLGTGTKRWSTPVLPRVATEPLIRGCSQMSRAASAREQTWKMCKSKRL